MLGSSHRERTLYAGQQSPRENIVCWAAVTEGEHCVLGSSHLDRTLCAGLQSPRENIVCWAAVT